jgi:LPXTG-motif cell wall-anchored protein
MTRIWKALAATLLGGAMVLGFGASPASASGHDDLIDQCQGTPFQPVCDAFEEGDGGDGGDGGDDNGEHPLQPLIEYCNALADNTDDEFRQLCDALAEFLAAEEEPEPEPEETTTTTAPPPPPTDPPAPPATEAPAPTAAGTGALPSTGGTGAGVALLAGGVLAAGALALRRFAAA